MAVRVSTLTRAARWARRIACGAVLAGLFLTTTARVSTAQDANAAFKDIATADDFRVRANAAALLGRARPRGAREALEKALADIHPMVRTAAAIALASIGDQAAIPALERQLAKEQSSGAKAQMKSAIETLKHGSAVSRAKFVVMLGAMKNNSGVRGDALAEFLAHAAHSRARMINGVVLTDGKDPRVLREAGENHVPVLIMDGFINGLTQGREDKNVTFRAQVEFSVRKNNELPKGHLSGAATSFGSLQVLGDKERVAALQNDAVDGAVQSALRGADVGLALASK